MTEASRPNLLVVSAVYPFPRRSGQQQRVYYKLKALRERFRVFFLTIATADIQEQVRAEIEPLCDHLLLLPSLYSDPPWARYFHKARGSVFQLQTGLKFSNYRIGEVEFSPRRLEPVLEGQTLDLALFEYWHAHRAVPVLRAAGTPCVLDMHNVLWQSYARQLEARPYLPSRLRTRLVSRYRQQEERAWQRFDGLIAINRGEFEYTRSTLPEGSTVFYAPMGIELEKWPYAWEPASLPRIAYYGGLGSAHNQASALHCYREIMPRIWSKQPQAEFWIVGSNPPASIRALEADPRLRVTGFVEDVGQVLGRMSFVLCPWSGTYGFRSRVIEVMALGVPVVASPSAVYGMDLGPENGLLLAETPEAMAAAGLRLLSRTDEAEMLSARGRRHVEEIFSYNATYAKLAEELVKFAAQSADSSASGNAG